MTKTNTATPAERGEEYVDFLIPAAAPDARAVFLGVNGAGIRVRPGEPVRVRRKYAEVWENAQAQERAAWEARRRAQETAKKALADL